MGVINLSVLIDKIKRKLINGGFITKNDKASGSKFGVVKIGSGINVASGVISVAASGSSIELLKSGDFSEQITTGSSNLRTITGKNLSDYKFIFITSTGSTSGSTSTAIIEVNTSLGMMGFNLNQNGQNVMIQFNLAKSEGSEVYDSIYCSYATNPGKWGNIYGLK